MVWGVDGHWPSMTMDISLTAPSLPVDYKRPAKARVIFDGAGHAATCEIKEASGSDTIDRSVCAYAMQQLTIPPPRSRSHDIPAAAVRYVTVTLTAKAAD